MHETGKYICVLWKKYSPKETHTISGNYTMFSLSFLGMTVWICFLNNCKQGFCSSKHISVLQRIAAHLPDLKGPLKFGHPHSFSTSHAALLTESLPRSPGPWPAHRPAHFFLDTFAPCSLVHIVALSSRASQHVFLFTTLSRSLQLAETLHNNSINLVIFSGTDFRKFSTVLLLRMYLP